MKGIEPKLSVVMTAYNAEKYIREAIESILNQTFTDFEFIIIDDCSTDATGAIIEEYSARDPRIVCVHNPKNLYISASTNIGIEMARTDIIAKMDADDIALPMRLEKQYAFIKDHPEVGVVGAWIEIISEAGKPLRIREYQTDDVGLRRKIFRYSPIAQPVCMYRKSVVNEFGGYLAVSAPAEDVNLWFKIGTRYKFANIPEVLLKYRFFENSNSNRNLRALEIKTLRLRWNAWRRQGYKPSASDFAYNIVQALTIFLMPRRLRIRLFDLVRSIF